MHHNVRGSVKLYIIKTYLKKAVYVRIYCTLFFILLFVCQCRLLINFAISLDRNHERRNVRTDLNSDDLIL